MPNIDEAIEALLSYQQADMEGVMVLTSRQAIHEVADELKRVRSHAQGDAGQWFPKDMAPKDGTHILVCHGIYGSRDGFDQFPPQVVHWFPDPEEPGFYPSHGIVQDSYNDKPVTFGYWRHLGEPPRDLPVRRTPAEVVHPDDFAQFLRDVEREQGNCSDEDTWLGYRQTAEAILEKFDVRPKHSSTLCKPEDK